MPAKAGIQGFQKQVVFWTSVFTGATNFLNLINNVHHTIGYNKKKKL